MPPLQVPPPARDDVVDVIHHRRCCRWELSYLSRFFPLFLLHACKTRATSSSWRHLWRSVYDHHRECRCCRDQSVSPVMPSFPNHLFFLLFLLPVREKGVLASATRHHHANNTATRSANVTRPHSNVQSFNNFLSSLFLYFSVSIGSMRLGKRLECLVLEWNGGFWFGVNGDCRVGVVRGTMSGFFDEECVW